MAKSWTDDALIQAVATCKSYRAVLRTVGLVPAGGNYVQVRRRTMELGLDTSHFTGKGWNKDNHSPRLNRRIPIDEICIEGSYYQSYKLKKRLFEAGLKQPACELCGWAEKSKDGRIPVELDHVNGNHHDNRIENLRILCPNCHSLQPTHRGRNKRADGVIGSRVRLKI